MLTPPCWIQTLLEIIFESRNPVLVRKEPPENYRARFRDLAVAEGTAVLATQAIPMPERQPSRLRESHVATVQMLEEKEIQNASKFSLLH